MREYLEVILDSDVERRLGIKARYRSRDWRVRVDEDQTKRKRKKKVGN